MKFTIVQITAAILSASAASAAYLEPRHDTSTASSSVNSTGSSSYPQDTNVNILNGTCKAIVHDREHRITNLRICRVLDWYYSKCMELLQHFLQGHEP
jgi:hypothetical protein